MAIRPRNGADRKLQKLMDFTKRGQSPEFLNPLGEAVATEALRLLDYGFGAATDPYGQPWEARTRDYPWPLLIKSTRMFVSFNVRGDHRGVFISNPVPYTKYHQGKRTTDTTLPRRMMYPDVDRGLGRWSAPLRKVADDFVKRAVRGA